QPTDMRKSFDGFAAMVSNAFSKDLFAGDDFVFFSRSLDRCKLLLWDRDRFVIWAKRLERGRFQRPLHAADGPSIEIDNTTVNMILGGADLKTGQCRQRYQRPRESYVQQTV
ncbi:MAG: IS66 family insertion sequence element accessory protein TnpB, partial [Burkholderiaceae bacterium]